MKIRNFTVLLSLLLRIFLFGISEAHAQNHDKGRFIFPIAPGQQNFLTGNMGELRHNHFHAGIDVKTRYQTGLKVHAAADGYVSQISVSPYGYGNMLTVIHGDGYSTVYAHLLEFNAAITKKLLEEQYRLRQNVLDVDLEPGELEVKQGEVIALSGNSGGSGGPHLHFEIRRHEHTILDPLDFGFKEIVDNIPPVIQRLALVTTGIFGRVQGDFGRYEPHVIAEGNGSYRIAAPVQVWGEFGLELAAVDKMDGLGNSFGVSCVEITVDGKEIYTHNLEKYDNRLKNHLNAHINYEEYKDNNGTFQRCYVVNGNRLNIHTGSTGGIISVHDEGSHEITLSVWDTYQNRSRLTFTVVGTKDLQPTFHSYGKSGLLSPFRLYENILKITGTPGTDSCIIFSQQGKQTLLPTYRAGTVPVYLYDIRSTLPDSVRMGDTTHTLNYKTAIYPGLRQTYLEDGLEITFSPNSLFDTLYLQVENSAAGLKIASPKVPLADKVTITYTPKELLPRPGPHVKGFVYTSGTQKKMMHGGAVNDTAYVFTTKELGRIILLEDTVPPLIRLRRKSAAGVELKVFDNLTGIEEWKATVNGKWLMMSYDYKDGKMKTELYDKTIPLKGSFVLEVKDGAGNTGVFKTVIN